MKGLKQFKLRFHQLNSSDEPLIFNSADLPSVTQNDLLQVYHCDGSASNYLLVQVKTLKDGLPKDTVSIEQNLASSFGLEIFKDVYVVKVQPEDVTIDLLEVSFKDQYISRSDMWRMKKYLVNSCTYIDQKLQFSEIRSQVSELWVNSKKSRCGYISNSTNFVFRSFTAKVYVFIQMSSEMWEYDSYGYLQFERAVNGFLKALFNKWKEKNCCHELTLVLFSRTLYETRDIRHFPESVQESVRQNYKGELYIDFYKCVVQTEKLEDCLPLVTELKVLFHEYEQLTQIPGCPKGKNSTSAEGNFLEAINMSLNVFEQHNINRNFDGTGQIVVCITPGVGVFDVDRDLTILTKERMIDNGIGSDLICLGQQPLHAVPLFKFHHKPPDCYEELGLGFTTMQSLDERCFVDVYDLLKINIKLRLQKSSIISKVAKTLSQPVEQDFNIPHWINHSFYTSNPFTDKGTTNINYIPRIHAPLKQKKSGRRLSSPFSPKPGSADSEELPNFQQMSFVEYDKQIFGCQKPLPAFRRIQKENLTSTKHSTTDNLKKIIPKISPDSKGVPSRPVHIPPSGGHGYVKAMEGLASSLGAAANLEKHFTSKQKDGLEVRPVIGSATTSRASLLDGRDAAPSSRRALFNPFNPALMFAPLTANRRRWVHTYPRGPQGEALVLHHRNSTYSRFPERIRQDSECADEDSGLTLQPSGTTPIFQPHSASPSYGAGFQASSPHIGAGFSTQHSIRTSFNESTFSERETPVGSNASLKGTPHSNVGNLEPSPAEGFASSKGLDWKSLKCPACLPITTDYCPQQDHLKSTCNEQSYSIVPDEVNYSNDRGAVNDEATRARHDSSDREGRSAREIFLELINQRLCHGFQIIKQSERLRNTDSYSSCATITSPSNISEGSFRSVIGGTSPIFASSLGAVENEERLPNTFLLSHGRQYHIVHLSSDEDKIEVKIYKPRHPSSTVSSNYNYMLWPKTRTRFQHARTSFAHEKVEDFYWNHLDNYVCDPDENSFQINNLKSWRTKFVVLAAPSKRLGQWRAANEGNEGAARYDVFEGCGCKRSHDNPLESGECGALTEGFIRFLEHLNKFKRKDNQNSRKSWKSFVNFSGNLSKSYSTASSSGLHHSNQATPTPPIRPTSSTPTSERTTPVRFQSEHPPPLSGSLSHGVDAMPVPIKSSSGPGQSGFSSPLRPGSLSINTEMNEVISAMKHPQSGLSFLPEQYGLPAFSFVSLEAAHWAIENIEEVNTIKEACSHLERMRSYGKFSHLSYDPTVPFQYGFFLFFIRDEQTFELEDPTSYQYHNDYLGPFEQSRWFEVSFKRTDLDKRRESPRTVLTSSMGRSGAFCATSRKRDRKDSKSAAVLKNKVVNISLMNNMRTNRTEWCQVKYSPESRMGIHTFIFCFELQWMVATATCLFKLLQTWFRDASRCDLYFCPVPLDPFAFPRTGVTGPLRSPLFVPLNLKCLMESSASFKDYTQIGKQYRDMIIAFMEAILRKFGFLRDLSDEKGVDQMRINSVSQNYIHFSGQVLAQIPVRFSYVQRNSVSFKQRPVPNARSRGSGTFTPHSETLDTAVTQTELDGTGFYWSFNYMQTKRWRIPVLEDCPPHDLERDFVEFSSNSQSRLYDFFQSFISVFERQ